MIENSLNIPLEVDMELCEPSWATKKDFKSKEDEVFEVTNYIDWE